MNKLRKIWYDLLCRYGFHDWTRWANCQYNWDTNEFRVCKRCPTRECRRTFLGVMADAEQFDAIISRAYATALATQVLEEFEGDLCSQN